MAAHFERPETKSLLAHHRLLSPTAAVRVSPLCLGAMNFGDSWKDFMGECNKETSFKILNEFYENGGNFIDTANFYQNEESEEWLGEWMESRKCREEMVIATKYTSMWPAKSLPKIRSNYTGNHTKSLKASVEASLKKLKTDYIDILYVHWWDSTTSIPELMQSLNHVVASGKVLYLGISDAPAWVVSKANEYARQSHLRGFSVYQGLWNAAVRDLERDILPMCRDEGMAIAPWGALGRGAFREESEGPKTEGRRSGATGMSGDGQKAEAAVIPVLAKIAKERNTLITSVAMAYVRSKYAYVMPIVGGRKVEHLKSNISALDILLTEKEIEELEDASGFDAGFPHTLTSQVDPEWKWSPKHNPGDHFGIKMGGILQDAPERPPPQPIKLQ